MAWTYNSGHGLSSSPTGLVIVDTSDTTFHASGTPKDLIMGADMTVNANVTLGSGDWGMGFNTLANGNFNYYGLTWSTGPACAAGKLGSGCTVMMFVNSFTSASENRFVGRWSGNSWGMQLTATTFQPYVAESTTARFTATTGWPTGTAFCHVIKFHGDTTASALYGLQSASDLSADGSSTPFNAGSSPDEVTQWGGATGQSNCVANWYQLLFFNELVSDADLQSIFDNPLIYVDTGAYLTTGTFGDKYGAAQAGLSGLSWAWFDEDVGALNAPTASGAVATTDLAGAFSIDVTGTALTAGQTGTLVIYDSTNEKFGAYRAIIGANGTVRLDSPVLASSYYFDTQTGTIGIIATPPTGPWR